MTLENMIDRAREEQLVKKHRLPLPSRKRRVWLALVADITVAGIVLCVFALFHHVIPQSYSTIDPTTPPTDSNSDTNNAVSSPMEQTFDEHFQFTPIMTDTSYTSKNISINVTTHEMGEENKKITYYVADIYLRSIECFRTAFADDTFGRGLSEPLLELSRRNNALLAISGDYYGLRNNSPVIRNGVLYREKNGNEDICVLYRDGTMKTFSGREFDVQKEMENGAWQAWGFGPSLLTEDGRAASSFNSTLTGKNPRCAIGYYEPGHYAFVLVDGRQDNYSSGMTMSELAQLFESMGCSVAYNMDGGRTAQMAFDSNMVNRPYLNGRDVSDIVYIGEVE